jgi:hypothetical protein
VQDVYKKVSAKHAGCIFWKCFENSRADKKLARRSGRRVLRQADLREFRAE